MFRKMEYKLDSNVNSFLVNVDNVSNSVFSFYYNDMKYYLVFMMPDSGGGVHLYDTNFVELQEPDLTNFGIYIKKLYESRSGATQRYVLVCPNNILFAGVSSLRFKGKSITCVDKDSNDVYTFFVQERGCNIISIAHLNPLVLPYPLYDIIDNNKGETVIAEVDFRTPYDALSYDGMYFIVDRYNISRFHRVYKAIEIDDNVLMCAGRIWRINV